MKDFLHIAAPTLQLVGAAVSVFGTFLMTQFYHPFGGTDFLKSLARMTWLAITRQRSLLGRVMEGTAGFASEENRALSLAGIYVLFLGLFLQTIGAALALVNVILE